MAKPSRKHLSQLAVFYAVLLSTGFLWRYPHTPLGLASLLIVYFGVAPWLVLSQRDQANA